MHVLIKFDVNKVYGNPYIGPNQKTTNVFNKRREL